MKWSVNAAAKEFRVDRRTLNRALEAFGESVGNGARFHTQVICGALFGEREREQIRLLKADAELKEMDLHQQRKELVQMADVQTLLTEMLLPIRQRWLALPAECCAMVNPSDPQFAREALQRWVDESLPLVRSGLPK